MPLHQTQTLIIRIRRPWLRRLLWGTVLVLLPIAFYLTYELGRHDGGYDRLTVWQSKRDLREQIDRLEKANSALRVKTAELETARVSQQQERLELARNVGDLQAQIARQGQDLSFYRGIVSSTVGGPTLKIQRLSIAQGQGAGRYRLRIVLVQSVRPERLVSGTVTFSLRGTEHGQPATYDLSRLAADARATLSFSFRYFQDIDQELILPGGFNPASISVEVRTTGGAEPLKQSFTWKV